MTDKITCSLTKKIISKLYLSVYWEFIQKYFDMEIKK